MRYNRKYISTQTGINNIKYLSTPILPRPEDITTEVIQYTTKPGDRYDTLAHRFYQNVEYYWVIMLFNTVTEPTIYIETGTVLNIPVNISSVLSVYTKLNS